MQAPGAARRLLAWYDAVRRPLPWRRDRDPYRVWVSEVMLQQTRVETAARYFEPFLARFPTPAALAAAGRDEVLAVWSGLGYYRRARDLHRAVQALAPAGVVPRSAAELQRLPGVGPYTAAAIASIAYGEAIPVLDGNVERVAARLGAVAGNPKRAATRKRLRAVAAALLEADRAGDSNQALMELGATLCAPSKPHCPECPLAGDCRARAQRAQHRFPGRPRRTATRRIRAVAVIVRGRGQRILLVRRADDEPLLGGTWELPWTEVSSRATGARLVAAAARRLARRYGGEWRLGPARAVVRHTMTSRAFHFEVRTATLNDGGAVAEGVAAGWFRDGDWRSLPRSALLEKILG